MAFPDTTPILSQGNFTVAAFHPVTGAVLAINDSLLSSIGPVMGIQPDGTVFYTASGGSVYVGPDQPAIIAVGTASGALTQLDRQRCGDLGGSDVGIVRVDAAGAVYYYQSGPTGSGLDHKIVKLARTNLATPLHSWTVAGYHTGLFRLGDVSRDGTIAYGTMDDFFTGDALDRWRIRRYDLVGSAFLSDLVSTPVDSFPEMVVCRPFSTEVFVLCVDDTADSGQRGGWVRRYTAAGVFVQQYDVVAVEAGICEDFCFTGDGTKFWVKCADSHSTGSDHLRLFDVASGALIRSVAIADAFLPGIVAFRPLAASCQASLCAQISCGDCDTPPQGAVAYGSPLVAMTETGETRVP